MNDLILKDTPTLSSLEVAEMTGKEHKHLLRDIDIYIEYLSKNGKSKIGLSDEFNVSEYFIESTYISGTRSYRAFDITRKGCDLIAHKMTGENGVRFTVAYIDKFYQMGNAPINYTQKVTEEKPQTNDKLKIQEMNARTRFSNMYLKLANAVETSSTEYKNILIAKATEALAGEMLIPLPKTKTQEKTLSATEMGDECGVSGNKIGRLSTKHNLKTPEYGEFYRDKSPYSNKEVDTFRYYESAIPKFKELLQEENN